MAAQPKLSDYSKWYVAQYVSVVNLANLEGGAPYRKFIQQFPYALTRDDIPGASPFAWSGLTKAIAFAGLKFKLPLNANGYSCLLMKACLSGFCVNYAYLYWRRGKGADGAEYMCYSPTFDSRDGEYRRYLARVDIFLKTCDEYASSLTVFEETVLGMLGSGALALSTTTFPAGDAPPENVSRMTVLTLAAILWLYFHTVRLDVNMPHISHSFTKFIAECGRARPELYTAVSYPLFDKNNPLMHLLQLLHIGSSVANYAAICGQKIVPLFVREAMQVNNYDFAVWREVLISRLASDLAINFVSPGFALYNQWTFLEGADPGLFENPAMGARYARSREALRAAAALREARRELAEAEHRGLRTAELSARVYESLEYARSFLLMSSVAIMHTMEDVGWTLGSISRSINPAHSKAFATPGQTTHHLFELAYAVHCLHTKLGVAHTDLHSNNMTLHIWSASSIKYDNAPVVVYVAGPRGEADSYVFPADGCSACVIDFSRAIVGPAFRPHLEEGRSPQAAANFYRDQVSRVMRVLHRAAPEYVELHQLAIKAAILARYDAVFPAVCAVDFIAVGAVFGEMVSNAATVGVVPTAPPADAPSISQTRFWIPAEVVESAARFARALEDAGREALITRLHAIVESVSKGMPPAVVEFPGAAILKHVFESARFPRWVAQDPTRLSTTSLVDAYNYNNALKYSGTDYTKFPPWANLDEKKRHFGAERYAKYFNETPFRDSLQPDAHIESISGQIRSEQEKLDGKLVGDSRGSWSKEQ